MTTQTEGIRGQHVRRAVVGVVDIVTGAITGYWALRVMFLPVNGGKQSGWPPIMLGASILLLVSCVNVVVPTVRGVYLALLALTIPLVLCGVLFEGLATRCWLFGFAVSLSTWVIRYAASSFRRTRLFPLIVSLILMTSWIPLSVNTLSLYLAPTTPSPSPRFLVLLLALWVLILASVAAGIAFCRAAKSDVSSSGGGFWHRTSHIRGAE